MRGSGWSVQEVVSEAFRNNLAAPVRLGLLVGLVGIIVGAGGLLDGLQILNIASSLDSELDRGSTVVIVSPEDGSSGGISGPKCEALRSVEGIVAVGAVRLESPINLTVSPDLPVQTASATKGAFQLWDPSIDLRSASGTTEYSVFIGSDLAYELGLSLDEFLIRVDSAPPWPTVAGVVDSSKRSQRSGRWIVSMAAASERYDECWIELLPSTFEKGDLAAPAWLREDGNLRLSTRPLVASGEFARDYTREFAGRVERQLWAVSGVLGGLLFWIFIWARRSELSLYRALGVGPIQLAVLVGVEVGTICSFAWLFAVSIVSSALFQAQSFDLEVFSILIRSMSASAAIPVLLTPIALVPVHGKSVAQHLKDRGL